MKATFTKAVQYDVKAVCRTPLRTGRTGGETELILRDQKGRALIQGSSLAGAFRSWLEQVKGKAEAEQLFGCQECSGHLMVSDGLFERDAESVIRPRLRINSATGTADSGGKFDTAHISTGSRFSFCLTWLGGKEMEAETKMVEQILAALHGGEIRLGAQKSNGFGCVGLTVKKRIYDLCQAEDHTAWLEDCEDGQVLPLPDIQQSSQVTFTLVGQADNILVKGASVEHEESSSVTRNLQEAGVPVIPGSSIKGAVRARAAMIAQWKGLPEDVLDGIFGRTSAQGDNGIAGRILFEDAVLSPDQSKKISRIRINRFTAGVIRGGLFSEEPVCSKLQIRITVPADCKTGCGLLVYALRDLALGLYNLGSGGAIGRGQIAVERIQIEAPDETHAELSFDDHRRCVLSDPRGLVKGWLDHLEVWA